MWPFDRKDKIIIKLIDNEYESLFIRLSKGYSDEIKDLRQLLASKGQLKDKLIKSGEFNLLINFVKKQADAYCETISKYHTNPNRAVSESNRIKYKERLENILEQVNEDLQSVNIIKDEARYKFESICSKVNYDKKEEQGKNRNDAFMKVVFGVIIGLIVTFIVRAIV